MLYVLECMFFIIFALTDKPLGTTGKPVTINDMGVGFLALLVVVAIIWFVTYSVRFSVNYKRLISDTKSLENNKKEKISYFWKGILYYFECYILLFLCFFKGKKLVMKTTGQSPSKNEIAISVIWWIYTALIVVSIILICI